ncbi:putative flippase GtrA [Metapseudomonas resinovorans]
MSYTFAYVLGILLSFFMGRHYVFNNHRGAYSVALFPLVYLLQYMISLLTLWLWVDQLGWSEKMAPLAAIVITIPATYFSSKLVFLKKPASEFPD